MDAVKTETRNMKMHKKLLLDTIKRQAGTLEKANLEGVRNSIEAGSPIVVVEFKVVDGIAHLSIHDTGRGIETKKEMIEHFETFGTPHEASECTTWKQFRMGRGQMFAFGKNTWRTATFKMEVDIDNKGLTYELTENLPFIQGCQIDIELYTNPIRYSSIDNYKERIQKQIRFMEIPIMFNGEQINTPASECKWDFEDKNSYYMFNTGSDFKVYNLGAYVMDASLSDMGMVGIVVSKKQLKVNFARNDVQHDCEVYHGYMKDTNEVDEQGDTIQKKIDGIKDVVKKNRIKKTRQRRRTLDTWERTATLKDLRDGSQDLTDVKTLGLIQTSQGKWLSLDAVRKSKMQWCFAPLGDRYADKLMERDQALCISEKMLDIVGYTGVKSMFFSWLTNTESSHNYGQDVWQNLSIMYVDFKKLSDGINDSYHIIPHKKYTKYERRIIAVLQGMGCWDSRQIVLGLSDTASGWTDAVSYIAIDREWLRRTKPTYGRAIATLMMLMAHEMAHDTDSRGTHVHGPEFYEKMVQILESYNSPICYCADFKQKMESSRVDEQISQENQKRAKAKAKQNEKLGIAAKV